MFSGLEILQCECFLFTVFTKHKTAYFYPSHGYFFFFRQNRVLEFFFIQIITQTQPMVNPKGDNLHEMSEIGCLLNLSITC